MAQQQSSAGEFDPAIDLQNELVQQCEDRIRSVAEYFDGGAGTHKVEQASASWNLLSDRQQQARLRQIENEAFKLQMIQQSHFHEGRVLGLFHKDPMEVVEAHGQVEFGTNSHQMSSTVEEENQTEPVRADQVQSSVSDAHIQLPDAQENSRGTVDQSSKTVEHPPPQVEQITHQKLLRVDSHVHPETNDPSQALGQVAANDRTNLEQEHVAQEQHNDGTHQYIVDTSRSDDRPSVTEDQQPQAYMQDAYESGEMQQQTSNSQTQPQEPQIYQ